jgi:sugar phosphate isomerase/epimerase
MIKSSIAVQLYTLHSECEKDFYGTLEKVAKLGFEGVELAGYWGKEAEELKLTLDRLGLKAISSHVSLDNLENNLVAELAYLKTLDCNNIVCPYLQDNQRDDYHALASKLNDIGIKCQQEGISLSYHNHEFELDKDGDKTYLDILFSETSPDFVKGDLDVYWLTFAGEDPIQWMERYSNRLSLLHLKDMTTDEEKTFAELGTGGVDIQAIVEKSKQVNIEWLIIEQDKCKRSPLESIEQSINYLKTIL